MSLRIWQNNEGKKMGGEEKKTIMLVLYSPINSRSTALAACMLPPGPGACGSGVLSRGSWHRPVADNSEIILR